MAKTDKTPLKTKKPKKPKGQGQISQIIQVLKMTIKFEQKNFWYLLAAGVLPLAAGVLTGIFFGGGWIGITLWSLTGLMAGLLLFLLVLGRRAENAAFRQLEGQEGAVGAAMKNLRRTWRGSEMPVAVNPRTRDAIYRAVGKPGVVLVVEGEASRVQKLIRDEERKISRVVPNIPIEVFEIGTGEGKTRLYKLTREMNQLPKKLNKHEVQAVTNRLESLSQQGPIGIPKGIDPFKVRPQRPR